MPEYRAYIVGQEGHFIRLVELLCTDDEQAKEYTKLFLLVDGHGVELWQLDRLIDKFKSV
jgi:hypothetical protein